MQRLSVLAILFVLAQVLYALNGEEAKKEGVIPAAAASTTTSNVVEGSGESSGEIGSQIEGSGTQVEGSGQDEKPASA